GILLDRGHCVLYRVHRQPGHPRQPRGLPGRMAERQARQLALYTVTFRASNDANLSIRQRWSQPLTRRTVTMDVGTLRLKVGFAEMLKGGVIMDVTTAEQAKIAQDAGAVAVMALERVPADIRKEGGVARMASVRKVKEIIATVSVPVMAKCRIGHFAE